MGKNPTRLKLHPGKHWRDSHVNGLHVEMCRCGRGPRTRFVPTPDAGINLSGDCDTVHCCAACAAAIEQSLQEELDTTY